MNQNLDEQLMTFVNILGIVVFILITIYHYVASAAQVIPQ